MARAIEELKLDVEELDQLLGHASRPHVKYLLTEELKNLKTEISSKEEAMRKQAENTTSGDDAKTAESKPVPSHPRLPTVDIKNYAWDQSEKFMKIYATVPGVQSVPKEQVTCSFEHKSFKLRCEAVKDKNYTCEVTTLLEEILPADSYTKIKTDMVLIMLKKKKAGNTWPYVTQTEKKLKDKKEKPAMDSSADPNESMMGLMRQMYEDGDDEMKRTIAKAWTESRDKKGQSDMAM